MTSQSPFPGGSFESLVSLEENHWWFCARNQIIIWVLKSKIYGIKNFLEVGCGTGYVISGIFNEFPTLSLHASEYFEEGLVFARQRVPSCEFRQSDATVMSEKNFYDCIGSFDVIEHIDQDQIALSNFNRALRPGGFLLITVPQHPWLWSAADAYAHHRRRYTYKQLSKKVLNAGFNINYSTSFVSLLMPIMMMQRFSLSEKHYDPAAEFKISWLLNKILRFIMFFEFLLLMSGVRLSVGGSLLILAQKR